MNCQEYRGMIEDALDVSLQGELKANIRRHLEHCPKCRDYLQFRREEHAALFAGVNAAYSHLRQPPPDFAVRVLREVESRQSGRRGWRRIVFPRWVLIAASLVAVAGFVFAASVAVETALGGKGADNSDNSQTGLYVDNSNANDGSSNLGCSSGIVDSSDRSLTSNEGENQMPIKKAAAVALTAAIGSAPLGAANGDGYQFIDPTTYPAANASYPSRSSAVAFDTGALRAFAGGDELEARSRTKACSQPISLATTDYFGMIIHLR